MKVSLEQASQLTGELKFAAYACLDATGTREIFDKLHPKLDEDQARIYAWSRAQVSPSVAMTLRGVKVDLRARDRSRKQVSTDLQATCREIAENKLVLENWDGMELETGFCPAGGTTKSGRQARHKWPRAPKGEKLPVEGMVCERCGVSRLRPVPFSPTSGDQVCHLLYDLLKAPKHFDHKSGNPTADGDALASIGRERKKLKPLTDALLQCRDLSKQMGFLNSELSPQGRFHSSFNVSAPWTGRWSSSKDPFRRGGNLQNIAERHRNIFVPDTGYELFYADLKTAESLQVAYISGCEAYIEAHKGDVHTYVCQKLWPDYAWTGDIKKDKKLAQSINPEWDKAPGHDIRFQSKRIQHGSNYGLSPHGMAMIAHIPVKHAVQAQESYFEAFPEIQDWHRWMRQQVETQQQIYNPYRRVVRLFGRPRDGHTFKQGLAFAPQGGVGDTLNLGIWRIWDKYDPHTIQILAQVHDAILGQYPIGQRDKVVPLIKQEMAVKTPITDIRGVTRICEIQSEVAVGMNWGKRSDANPQGMVEVA